MKRRFLVQFGRVPVGAAFTKNGSRCTKRSARTADITHYVNETDSVARRSYYGRRELVEVLEDVARRIADA